MAFLSPSRTVLILGDDGLQIYSAGALSSRFIEFIPWNTMEFETVVKQHLVKSCKRKSVVILNNMVEQHYRKERVPKVGLMDRASVVKRRLAVAFPNYKVRAALKLDQNNARAMGEGKGIAYLFAAVPAAESFAKTLQAIRQANVSIVGFYLLPIESASMVKALSAKISKPTKRQASWSIFMGQHHNGGVRQIVTRDGELALTRMTPIVDTDIEPELWAKEISGELNATMSYLTRFGYKDTDGLNVIVIANDATEQALENMIHLDCNLQVMSSQAVAKLLNINLGQQQDLRYADPLHAAYVGRKNKFILPMESPAINSMTNPRKVAALVIGGLLLTSAYFGYDAFSKWTAGAKTSDDLRVAQERKLSVTEQYNAELEKKKAIGFDFLLVNNSVELYNEISEEQIEPLSVLAEIGQSLGVDLTLDNVEVKSVQEKKKKDDGDKQYYNPQEKEEMVTLTEAVMTISYDESIDPDLGVRKTNELRDRIAKRLPEYDVGIIKQVADLSYTGNFVGEAGTNFYSEDEDIGEDYIAEIRVRGPKQ